MTAAYPPYPDIDDRAPCRRGDPDRFFPKNHVSDAVLDECRACPFIDGCAAYALHHDVVGIWGATTTTDRRAARKRAGIVPRPVQVGHAGGHLLQKAH